MQIDEYWLEQSLYAFARSMNRGRVLETKILRKIAVTAIHNQLDGTYMIVNGDKPLSDWQHSQQEAWKNAFEKITK